jgi:NAD(P)-dependent dehydrogenase (short-subunit alcohol dehydrogenase family)
LNEPAAPRTFLVTGASTGIGRCIAERLAGQGHRVLAGARKASDLESLAAVERVKPLLLDVNQPSAIAAAVATVQAQGSGLDGLVNNAGIGGLGLLHTWTDEELQLLFDTNVFGPMRMSRACLPLLLASRGRIVHIGSQGGSITSTAFGPYTMSKHALEALAQCQREELAPHGVSVSIVQPGGVDTAIGANGAAGTEARWQRAAAPFDAMARQVLAGTSQPAAFDESAPESAANRRLSPPVIVADAVMHALLSPAPRARYLVGTRWEGDRVVRNLLARLLDAGEALKYSRDELIAQLDAQLAARR